MDKPSSYMMLFQNVKSLIESAQRLVARNINTTMLLTYFEIGRMIVEEELNGKTRAGYAERVLQQLSTALTREFGKGYSKSNLEYMRQFYTVYQSRAGLFPPAAADEAIIQSVIGQSPFPFRLSWTHYIQLLKIASGDERNFYEIEAVENNWSVRELQRQYHASLYERLALSRDKEGVRALAQKGQVIEKPADALKSPYVLEFLELREDNRYSENDLETAIINKLEHFLRELGKGFLFDGRQKRFTFNGDHFYVDLVFYNRLLRCFVLVDLKIGKLTHQDIGQMQMYVNYYDRIIKTKGEKPTIGIILCKEGNEAIVEFTLPKTKNQIFTKEYKLYLPTKEDLKKQIY